MSLYLMTPEYGAAPRLDNIDMLDFKEITVINKFDKHVAICDLHDVMDQYKRNYKLFEKS